MNQTRKHSAIESVFNVIVGYGIAVGSQILIFPLFNVHIPLSDNFLIGGYFTIISLLRSYILRRLFTKRRIQQIKEQK